MKKTLFYLILIFNLILSNIIKGTNNTKPTDNKNPKDKFNYNLLYKNEPSEVFVELPINNKNFNKFLLKKKENKLQITLSDGRDFSGKKHTGVTYDVIDPSDETFLGTLTAYENEISTEYKYMGHNIHVDKVGKTYKVSTNKINDKDEFKNIYDLISNLDTVQKIKEQMYKVSDYKQKIKNIVNYEELIKKPKVKDKINGNTINGNNLKPFNESVKFTPNLRQAISEPTTTPFEFIIGSENLVLSTEANGPHNLNTGDKILLTDVTTDPSGGKAEELNNDTFYVNVIDSLLFVIYTDSNFRYPIITADYTQGSIPQGGNFTVLSVTVGRPACQTVRIGLEISYAYLLKQEPRFLNYDQNAIGTSLDGFQLKPSMLDSTIRRVTRKIVYYMKQVSDIFGAESIPITLTKLHINTSSNPHKQYLRMLDMNETYQRIRYSPFTSLKKNYKFNPVLNFWDNGGPIDNSLTEYDGIFTDCNDAVLEKQRVTWGLFTGALCRFYGIKNNSQYTGTFLPSFFLGAADFDDVSIGLSSILNPESLYVPDTTITNGDTTIINRLFGRTVDIPFLIGEPSLDDYSSIYGFKGGLSKFFNDTDYDKGIKKILQGYLGAHRTLPDENIDDYNDKFSGFIRAIDYSTQNYFPAYSNFQFSSGRYSGAHMKNIGISHNILGMPYYHFKGIKDRFLEALNGYTFRSRYRDNQGQAPYTDQYGNQYGLKEYANDSRYVMAPGGVIPLFSFDSLYYTLDLSRDYWNTTRSYVDSVAAANSPHLNQDRYGLYKLAKSGRANWNLMDHVELYGERFEWGDTDYRPFDIDKWNIWMLSFHIGNSLGARFFTSKDNPNTVLSPGALRYNDDIDNFRWESGSPIPTNYYGLEPDENQPLIVPQVRNVAFAFKCTDLYDGGGVFLKIPNMFEKIAGTASILLNVNTIIENSLLFKDGLFYPDPQTYSITPANAVPGPAEGNKIDFTTTTINGIIYNPAHIYNQLFVSDYHISPGESEEDPFYNPTASKASYYPIPMLWDARRSIMNLGESNLKLVDGNRSHRLYMNNKFSLNREAFVGNAVSAPDLIDLKKGLHPTEGRWLRYLLTSPRVRIGEVVGFDVNGRIGNSFKLNNNISNGIKIPGFINPYSKIITNSKYMLSGDTLRLAANRTFEKMEFFKNPTPENEQSQSWYTRRVTLPDSIAGYLWRINVPNGITRSVYTTNALTTKVRLTNTTGDIRYVPILLNKQSNRGCGSNTALEYIRVYPTIRLPIVNAFGTGERTVNFPDSYENGSGRGIRNWEFISPWSGSDKLPRVPYNFYNGISVLTSPIKLLNTIYFSGTGFSDKISHLQYNAQQHWESLGRTGPINVTVASAFGLTNNSYNADNYLVYRPRYKQDNDIASSIGNDNDYYTEKGIARVGNRTKNNQLYFDRTQAFYNALDDQNLPGSNLQIPNLFYSASPIKNWYGRRNIYGSYMTEKGIWSGSAFEGGPYNFSIENTYGPKSLYTWTRFSAISRTVDADNIHWLKYNPGLEIPVNAGYDFWRNGVSDTARTPIYTNDFNNNSLTFEFDLSSYVDNEDLQYDRLKLKWIEWLDTWKQDNPERVFACDTLKIYGYFMGANSTVRTRRLIWKKGGYDLRTNAWINNPITGFPNLNTISEFTKFDNDYLQNNERGNFIKFYAPLRVNDFLGLHQYQWRKETIDLSQYDTCRSMQFDIVYSNNHTITARLGKGHQITDFDRGSYNSPTYIKNINIYGDTNFLHLGINRPAISVNTIGNRNYTKNFCTNGNFASDFNRDSLTWFLTVPAGHNATRYRIFALKSPFIGTSNSEAPQKILVAQGSISNTYNSGTNTYSPNSSVTIPLKLDFFENYAGNGPLIPKNYVMSSGPDKGTIRLIGYIYNTDNNPPTIRTFEDSIQTNYVADGNLICEFGSLSDCVLSADSINNGDGSYSIRFKLPTAHNVSKAIITKIKNSNNSIIQTIVINRIPNLINNNQLFDTIISYTNELDGIYGYKAELFKYNPLTNQTSSGGEKCAINVLCQLGFENILDPQLRVDSTYETPQPFENNSGVTIRKTPYYVKIYLPRYHNIKKIELYELKQGQTGIGNIIKTITVNSNEIFNYIEQINANNINYPNGTYVYTVKAYSKTADYFKLATCRITYDKRFEPCIGINSPYVPEFGPYIYPVNTSTTTTNTSNSYGTLFTFDVTKCSPNNNIKLTYQRLKNPLTINGITSAEQPIQYQQFLINLTQEEAAQLSPVGQPLAKNVGNTSSFTQTITFTPQELNTVAIDGNPINTNLFNTNMRRFKRPILPKLTAYNCWYKIEITCLGCPNAPSGASKKTAYIYIPNP